MKTLQAFWHWVDNERPAEITYRHLEPLSPVADRALDLACELVCERLGRYATPIDKLREHWPAVQGLSFLLCTALEVMHEDVPEVPARPSEAPSADVIVVDSADMNDPRNWVMRTVETPWLQPVTVPGSALEYRREYQGEWVTGIDLAKDAPEPLHAVARRVNEQMMNGDGLKPLRADPNEVLAPMVLDGARVTCSDPACSTWPEHARAVKRARRRPEPPVGAD